MAEKSIAGAPGLRLKMHGSGTTGSWSVLGRINGKKTRVTFADYPGVTEAKAKRLAADVRTEMRAGVDRNAQKREAAAAVAVAGTMTEQAARYTDVIRTTPSRSGEMRSPKYIHNEKVALAAILDAMGAGNLPPSAITKTMIDAALDDEPRQASRRTKHAALGRMMKRLWKKGVITENVMDRVDNPGKAKDRSRFYTAAEVQALWIALDDEIQPYGDLFQLLVALPLRREEASRITGAMVDLDERVLRLPAAVTKSDRDFEIPIPRHAVNILERRMTDGLLFPARQADKPVRNFSRAVDRVRKASGVSDFRLHDFRRTIATALAEAGVGFEVADALLNHSASASRGGITGVYQRAELKEPKRRAMDLWADLLDRAITTGSFEAEDNVIPLTG